MLHQPTAAPGDRPPFVTFIVPVYNIPAAMLCECIDSLLSLHLSADEREIVIVDDGSGQRVSDVLGDRLRHTVCIRTPNGGVSVARNTGLRMAHGVFVQFVDGDDMLLQEPYDHVLKTAHSDDCSMVMFDFSEKPHHHQRYKDEPGISGTELMSQHNIHGSAWGYLFRRDLLGSLRFTPGVAYGEDEEFTAQLLLRAENVYRTSAKAYLYRKRACSALRTEDKEKHISRLDDNKEVIKRLSRQLDKLPADGRKALERRVAQMTMDYIYNTIRLTRDRLSLDQRLAELKEQGLFPLPDRNYTTKYKWFRRMTNTETGLRLLMRVLPIMEKER